MELNDTELIKDNMHWRIMEAIQDSQPFLEWGWNGFIPIAFDRVIFDSEEVNIGEYL